MATHTFLPANYKADRVDNIFTFFKEPLFLCRKYAYLQLSTPRGDFTYLVREVNDNDEKPDFEIEK